ncbi:MAG: EAL domain-containing protein [Gallionellaceae bacterium]
MKIKFSVNRLALCLLSLLFIVTSQLALANVEDKQIRIGITSVRSAEQTLKQWQPTADYLNQVIPEYHFSIVPLYLDKLKDAVKNGEIEFLLSNPEQYVFFRADYGLAALATLNNFAAGKPVSKFGGVIFALADRTDLNTLADLKGKKISAVGERSFAAYLIQRWDLYQQGIDIQETSKVSFLGLPQDKEVMAVIDKQADVGFARTGVLEAMAAENKIQLSQIKVLNLQDKAIFPQALSTELYPEWPLSATHNLPDSLSKSVAQALFSISPTDPAARSGKYSGFMPPGDYSSVEKVMVKMRAMPSPNAEFDLHDIVEKYLASVTAGIVILLLLILATALHLWRNNRYLRHAYFERDQLTMSLSLANSSLEAKVDKRTRQFKDSQTSLQLLLDSMSEGMYGVDTNGNCTFVNAAFLRILGFKNEDELIGEHIHTLIHHSHPDGTPYPAKECRMFQAFRANQATHADDEVFWRKDGTPLTVEYWAHPTINDGVVVGAVATFQDITARKQAELQIQQLAFYDVLTSLPNRRLLNDRLHKALAYSDRNHNYGAVLFMDLDHFKKLNDTRGHHIGDLLLIEVGKRIESCVRDGDTVARLGGDEFVVILGTLSTNSAEAANQAEMVSEKIHTKLNQPYELGDFTHSTSPSIGIVLFKGLTNNIDELLKFADIAMYQAKTSGRNAIRFYDPDMQKLIEQRASLEVDLRQAIELEQFILHYQIQVDAQGKALGAEVLLRWQHPQMGLVPPLRFIPLAEETGLILPISLWVLKTACEQLKKWQADELTRELSLAVNITALQFNHDDFVAQVRQILLDSGANPSKLKLEITESMMLKNIELIISKMHALKALGLSFSLDDFGTGYSSLQYLKRLPLDQIKIDQSFVRDISTDPNDDAIVKTVIAMAAALDFNVIAEGVETEIQLNFLKQSGCRAFQGYLFSKPVPLAEFEAKLQK